MSKLIIVSNRLPVTVSRDGDKIKYTESIGGLATGLKKCHQQAGSLWVGWPGIADAEINDEEKAGINDDLKKYKCSPVFLSQDEIDMYYFGFSNDTIWPLFHYFTTKVNYDAKTWECYKKVNEIFCEKINSVIEEGDTVWIHDYQLMLLPELVRKSHPNCKIGFFLHIPFPSYEIFRLLPQRNELLEGLLGADLVGFHTYDYVRHFLSSVRRIRGYENEFNVIDHEDNLVKVDVFPMGIDYDFFAGDLDDSQISEEVKKSLIADDKLQTILSVDRLDYTKGIPERLKAFDAFLKKYPEYKGRVRLNLIVAPSRVEIDKYEKLLREINELVSDINSTCGTMFYMPVWFLFRSFSQEDMIRFYRNADVLLVTPLRDGMNLIAKEYIVANRDYKGMVVISETAGAASELAEAIIVNPNDMNSVVEGIKTALDMPVDEQISRNKTMHGRLKRYDVNYWAEDFLHELEKAADENEIVSPVRRIITGNDYDNIGLLRKYREAEERLIMLDYDGTLVGFQPVPERAVPDKELKGLLTKLAADDKNTVVIMSGRDKDFLEKWLSDIEGINLVASHGMYMKRSNMQWKMTITPDNKWQESVLPVMLLYQNRMPGSLIEEKDFSLAFHYRRCDPEMAEIKINELRAALATMVESSFLIVQEGHKVLEIIDSKFNKGNAASLLLSGKKFPFIFAAGDDRTDENLFKAMPDDAFSIKVGREETAANYRVNSWKNLRELLGLMANADGDN